MLRCKARIQAFGRDLEAASVMVCTCGPIGLSVFDHVKGLQELSAHGVDLDVTRQVFRA
jgi:hypothetical protein